MYKDGLKHIQNKIKDEGSWRPWQKLLGAAFLITLLIINSGALFQCLSLIVNVYYQVDASLFKDVNLVLTVGGSIFFITGAIASARLLSKILSNWMFGKM